MSSSSSLVVLPSFKSFLATTASHVRQKTSLSPIYTRSHQLVSSRPSSASSPVTYNFVIGNQAGDTDSCISSLTLAYQLALESHAPYASDAKRGVVPVSLFDADRCIHVPVLPFPRADLSLRADTVMLLSWADVDPSSDLLFIDDESVCTLISDSLRCSLDDSSSSRSSATPAVSLTLVDHATFNPSRSFLSSIASSSFLSPSDVSSKLSSRVRFIVDHHPENPVDKSSHRHLHPPSSSDPAVTTIAIPPSTDDGGATPPPPFSPRVVVDPLASCATLVAERSLSFLSYLSSAGLSLLSENKLDLRASLLLLHGTVSLDSGSASSGKKTPRDAALLAALESALSVPFPSTPPSLLPHLSALSLSTSFRRLMDRRTDPSFWASLSPADAARLDYKRFECCVVGSPDEGSGSDALSRTVGPAVIAVGMASICIGVGAFADAARLEVQNGARGLKGFVQGEDIAALIVMGHGSKGREILILDGGGKGGIMGDTTMALALGRRLKEKEGEGVEGGTLLLNDMDAGETWEGGGDITAFTQGNAKGSRKQVAPIIVDLVKAMFA